MTDRSIERPLLPRSALSTVADHLANKSRIARRTTRLFAVGSTQVRARFRLGTGLCCSWCSSKVQQSLVSAALRGSSQACPEDGSSLQAGTHILRLRVNVARIRTLWRRGGFY